MSLSPETIKQIEQQAKDMAIECPDYELGYVDGATAFATKLSLAEEENKRLITGIENLKNILEWDTVANGTSELSSRLHIELCVLLNKSKSTEALKQQP